MDYRVEQLNLQDGETRYALVQSDGNLATLPCKFLKHLANLNKSPYTQRSYAYALKLYATFLDRIGIEYPDADMATFSKFVAWLQDPTITTNVVKVAEGRPQRCARTVNTYMAAIISFYRYLYEMAMVDINVNDFYSTQDSYGGTPAPYKDFLYHTHKGRRTRKSVFHVKEPKRRIDVLTPKQVSEVLRACRNPRDKFMIYLLFASGLRVGEMLSLFNEDIVFDHSEGHRIVLHDRGLLSNGGKLKSGERTIPINQTCLDLLDDYIFDSLDSFDKDTDFLFVKVKGPNAGMPLTYSDVMAVFERLGKRTGLDLHPHLFRHTHATIYYAKTKNAKQLQERLGHADIQTTLNMYVHPTSEDVLNDWKSAQHAFELGEL